MELISQVYDKQAFKNISCVGQNMSDKDFSDCSFDKCDFSECNFSNASFNTCSFFGCNLTNIKVNNCIFQGVLFEKSKLLGTRFSTLDSLLIGWTFKSCVLKHDCLAALIFFGGVPRSVDKNSLSPVI